MEQARLFDRHVGVGFTVVDEEGARIGSTRAGSGSARAARPVSSRPRSGWDVTA
jgi:hypothetical protein